MALILGILTASTVPRFRGGWSRLQHEHVAAQMAQALRVARTVAVAEQRPVVWVWHGDERQVRLEGLDPDGQFRAVSGRFGRPRRLPGEVTLAVLLDGEPAESILFYPDGTSQAATVQIRDHQVSVYELVVDGTTGQVALQQGRLSAR